MQNDEVFEKTRQRLLRARELAKEVFGDTKGEEPLLIGAILSSLALDECTLRVDRIAERLGETIAQSAAVASGA